MDNPNSEYIFVFGKDSVSFPCESQDSDITPDEYDRFAIGTWYIGPQHRKPTENDDHHPVPYPEELVYRLIKLYCPTWGPVLDPFNGSGTTTFVADALGRPWIGLDNSQLYNDGANKRMDTLKGLTASEKLSRITHFVPVGRTDGFEQHCKIKPSIADKTSVSADAA
jgi:DNA modification methylase